MSGIEKKPRLGQHGVIAMVRHNIGILVVLILICIILTIMTDKFLTVENLLSVMQQISNNIFLALGMCLVIVLGGIDLAVGAIVSLTGTLTVGMIVTNGLPMGVAIVLGLIFGTLVGALNGVIISYFKLPAFIVTLATMNIARGAAFIYSGGRATRITSPIFEFIGVHRIANLIPIPVVYMVIFIIIFSVLLNRTKLGTYIYAVGGNSESARLSGVSIKKVTISVFTISGLMAAFAGLVLSSKMFSGQPSAGEGYEMDAIAACVLGGVSMSGGTGRISGTVIGAFVIGFISNGLNLMSVNSFWQQVLKGIIILVAVIVDSEKAAITKMIQGSKAKQKALN